MRSQDGKNFKGLTLRVKVCADLRYNIYNFRESSFLIGSLIPMALACKQGRGKGGGEQISFPGIYSRVIIF